MSDATVGNAVAIGLTVSEQSVSQCHPVECLPCLFSRFHFMSLSSFTAFSNEALRYTKMENARTAVKMFVHTYRTR